MGGGAGAGAAWWVGLAVPGDLGGGGRRRVLASGWQAGWWGRGVVAAALPSFVPSPSVLPSSCGNHHPAKEPKPSWSFLPRSCGPAPPHGAPAGDPPPAAASLFVFILVG